MNLGAITLLQGRCSEATSYFTKALAIDSTNAGSFVNLGSAFRCMGNSTEAIRQYKTALKLRPTMHPALLNLAIMLADAGRPEEALTRCSVAAGLEPKSYFPKWCEAYVWLGRKDGTTVNNMTNAIKALQIVYNIAQQGDPPQFPADALLDMVDAFLLKGDPKSAQKEVSKVISYFNRASGGANTLARAHLYLGRVSSRLGDKAKRDSEFKLAQKLDPYIKYQNLLDWQPPWSRDDFN